MSGHSMGTIGPTTWEPVPGKVAHGFVGRCSCGWEAVRQSEVKARRAVVGHIGGHALNAGLRPRLRHAHCKYGHPYDDANTYVRPDGCRECWTCKRQSQRADRASTKVRFRDPE